MLGDKLLKSLIVFITMQHWPASHFWEVLALTFAGQMLLSALALLHSQAAAMGGLEALTGQSSAVSLTTILPPFSPLFQSYYYDEETEAPLYLPFFEDQIEVKKEHAKQFITYLREHRSKICLPVIKRPDIDNWGTGIQAIESALQLENTLNKLLQDLMNLASQNSETDFLLPVVNQTPEADDAPDVW
ncbi:soma ferritin-like [Panthera leo]|uniref:soma ferritin-like n=1 Tax=Panthera leo TaxID=9689 RepID=UPI001C69ED3D|nr:soma ferritin-like [Panthera leo]